jgi:hypothetical protein
LHSYYKDYDFRTTNINLLGNLFMKNSFYGKTIHPYEILFIKANRDIDINKLNKII